MAIVTSPLFSEEAHGSLGGIVFRSHRGAAVVSAKAAPCSDHTKSKNDRLKWMPQANDSWRAMGNHYRRMWFDFGVRNAHRSKCGNFKKITGYNWYTSTFVLKKLLGEEAANFPPSWFIEVQLGDIELSLDGDDIVVNYNYHGTPSKTRCYIEIYKGGPHSFGRFLRVRDCKRAGAWPLPTIPTLTTHHQSGTYTLWIRIVDSQGLTGMMLWRRITARY